MTEEIEQPPVRITINPDVEEAIDHPAHYQVTPFQVIEVLDVIEGFDLGFNLGNVIKYVLRADKKGASLEDLQKAHWYLQREIERRELPSAGP